ncbi:MAG: hypothetical protein IT461_01900 [Planctomycetes bacterium]|nr:hypothetical protein [Planctomycetota bacterium]
MSKKRSLLDALKDRQNQSAKSNAALEAAGGAGQLMQVGGAAVSLAPGPGAVIGAVMTLGGMFLGNIASSFQTKRMREEIEFVADCVDKLPETWAQNGTLEEHILPAVVKHMTWRAQENHKEKVQAMRTHLRKKLFDGAPISERDTLHQHVEKFLTEATVSELICLTRFALGCRAKEPFVERLANSPDALSGMSGIEENIANASGVSGEEAYYAFRALAARGFAVSVGSVRRDTNAMSYLPERVATAQNRWTLSRLAHQIATWLDEQMPPPTTTG